MTPTFSTVFLRTQSDHRLTALSRDGHDRAFEAIVERYSKPLHAYCRRVLPASRAEDVVQQTFMSAWTALREGADVKELRAWLYRIAHNNAINAAKRSGYDYDELSESLHGAADTAVDAERRRVIRDTLTGLASLPERQREALLRTAVEGRSQEEVARELGLTDGAVRQLVHRARTSLRSAASAVTPLPLATWFASSGADAPVAVRVAELASGAGSAGIGALVVKGGTVAVVAAAVATGGTPGLRHAVLGHAGRDAAAAASPRHGTTTPAPRSAPASARLVSGVSTAGDASGSSGGGRGRRDDAAGKHGDRSGPSGRSDRSGAGDGDANRSGEDQGGTRSSGDGQSGGDRHSSDGPSRDHAEHSAVPETSNSGHGSDGSAEDLTSTAPSSSGDSGHGSEPGSSSDSGSGSDSGSDSKPSSGSSSDAEHPVAGEGSGSGSGSSDDPVGIP